MGEATSNIEPSILGKLDNELAYYLRHYLKYTYSENPRNYKSYLININTLFENFNPYMRQRFELEETKSYLLMDFINYPIQSRFQKIMPLLAQSLDLKIGLYPVLIGNEIKPLKTFLIIGKKSNYYTFVVLLMGLMNSYDRYLKSKAQRIKIYNAGITYHKNKSPHKVHYHKLKGANLLSKVKIYLDCKQLYTFYRLAKLKHIMDAPMYESKPFKDYKKEVNSIIKTFLGPKWRDRKNNTKTTRYYYGTKPYKIINRWPTQKTLLGYTKPIKELKLTLNSLTLPKIPKDLPPMPKHSRKPKGALEAWRPKQYRTVKTNT
jgi:hypothetical protein